MIGLEFIAREANIQFKDIAIKLGIKPQTINSWLRGDRKIPPERLKQLSGIEQFKEIPIEYFQKKLTKLDEKIIENMIMENSFRWEEIEDVLIDEKGNPITYTTNVLTNGDIDVLELNNAQIKHLKAVARVENAYDISSCEMIRDAISEINSHSELINLFGEILESKKANKYILGKMLYGILINLNKKEESGNSYKYQDDKFVDQLDKIINKDIERSKKEAEKWGSMQEIDE